MWGVLSFFTEYRVKYSVDECRRLSATERFRILDRLIDRALRRDRRICFNSVPMDHLDERYPQDAPLKRGDPRGAPAIRVALDQHVKLLSEVSSRMGKRPRQLGRIRRQRLRQRASGEVVLIERYDRSAPLLAAPHLPA
jgi:hypothetical protein